LPASPRALTPLPTTYFVGTQPNALRREGSDARAIVSGKYQRDK
jgi:hypothetical protein